MQDVKGMKENLSQMPIVIICVWRHVLVNHSKVVSKLHEVQELAGSESMSAMLQKMAQACSLLHYQAEDKLPKVHTFGNPVEGMCAIVTQLQSSVS